MTWGWLWRQPEETERWRVVKRQNNMSIVSNMLSKRSLCSTNEHTPHRSAVDKYRFLGHRIKGRGHSVIWRISITKRYNWDTIATFSSLISDEWIFGRSLGGCKVTIFRTPMNIESGGRQTRVLELSVLVKWYIFRVVSQWSVTLGKPVVDEITERCTGTSRLFVAC